MGLFSRKSNWNEAIYFMNNIFSKRCRGLAAFYDNKWNYTRIIVYCPSIRPSFSWINQSFRLTILWYILYDHLMMMNILNNAFVVFLWQENHTHITIMFPLDYLSINKLSNYIDGTLSNIGFISRWKTILRFCIW